MRNIGTFIYAKQNEKYSTAQPRANTWEDQPGSIDAQDVNDVWLKKSQNIGCVPFCIPALPYMYIWCIYLEIYTHVHTCCVAVWSVRVLIMSVQQVYNPYMRERCLNNSGRLADIFERIVVQYST